MNKFWLYRYDTHGATWVLLQSEAPRYDRQTAHRRADLLKQSFANNFEYGVVYSETAARHAHAYELDYRTDKNRP